MERWIVVVDDEAVSLANAKSMLSQEDIKVSCLRSGTDFLRFMEKNTPDLVLLDVLMPVMDGFDIYKALRELEDNLSRPHVPVIFLTGDQNNSIERKGLEIGASDFIRKPLNREILLRRIDNTIKNNKTIETLTEEAMIDMLTGVLNKARGTERVSKLCGRKSGALMIMDLDNFKPVNDIFGHDMGDKILKAFADIIRKNTRETDTVCRIGGDEFLAFYEDLTEESAVSSLTLRLNHQLQEEAEKLMGKDHGIPLGISIGVVMIPARGRDFDMLFSMADKALYFVKQNGKHGYKVYEEESENEEIKDEDPEVRLERIIKIVEERYDRGGALILGSDSFALIYRFVMRSCKKYGESAALLMFDLSMDEHLSNIKRLELSADFSEVLVHTLEMSDVIMQSGLTGFYVLLTDRSKKVAKEKVNKVINAWNETDNAKKAIIKHTYKYINPNGGSTE